MARATATLAVALAVLVPAGGAPRLGPPNNGLPVGKWRVEFANGVVETCRVGDDGDAAVAEPRRSAPGQATVRDGRVVIAFADDRVERWKRVGRRWAVEHWFPAAAFPDHPPVPGTAEPAK